MTCGSARCGAFRRADADDPRHGRGWRVGRRHSRTKGLKAGSEVVLYTFVGTDGAGVMPGERRSILSERYAGTMSEYTQVPAPTCSPSPRI